MWFSQGVAYYIIPVGIDIKEMLMNNNNFYLCYQELISNMQEHNDGITSLRLSTSTALKKEWHLMITGIVGHNMRYLHVNMPTFVIWVVNGYMYLSCSSLGPSVSI